MTTIVNIHEAKTHLSRLLEQVQRGEEVVVAKAGKPVARIVPIEAGKPKRVPGSHKGLVRISDDFNDPLPPDLQKYFE